MKKKQPQLPGRRGMSLIEVMISVMIMTFAVLVFSSLYIPASSSARMSGNYVQAISVVQHKVDQLRAIGYGRLNYTDLKAAAAIDASPSVSPFRFDAVDSVGTYLKSAVATITIADVSTGVRRATIKVTWTGSTKSQGGTHEVAVLIPNE